MKEEKFTIVRNIAVLSKTNNGWTKEINVIDWHGKGPKIDIRTWHHGINKIGKGVTLSDTEAIEMVKALTKDLNVKGV